MATVRRIVPPIRNPVIRDTSPLGLDLMLNPSGGVSFANSSNGGGFLGIDPLGIGDFRADVERDLPGILVAGAVLVVGVILIVAGVNTLAAGSALSAIRS